jgi:bacillolysin
LRISELIGRIIGFIAAIRVTLATAFILPNPIYMIQRLRAGLLGALPLLAVASASAQSLPTDGTPQLRRLPATTAAALRQQPLDSRQLLRQELGLRPADDMRPLRVETDEQGQRHERFQQYFQGVKVEHGVYTVHRSAGVLSGELKPVPAGLSIKPALSEAAALQRGLASVGAHRYMWEDAGEEAALKQVSGNPAASYRPVGELVLVEDYRVSAPSQRPLVLAWKFNIYAQQPETRAWVYVDARSGAIVLEDAIIKHAKGLVPEGSAKAQAVKRQPAKAKGVTSSAMATFATRYSGSQQVATDLNNGVYRLRDYTRAAGIETYNLRNGTNLAAGTDFTDNDNNWTAAEFNNTARDNAALDAHFGSRNVFDYWMNVHGRNSYDDQGGKLINYVHFSSNYDNANWNGSAMRYGDGATLFNPLTALDVCAHETGHGVCQETAGLVYQSESGALNEGFSDIWGATIEQYVDPTKQTWIVGEEITRNSGGLRSMINPLSTAVLTSCPANYRGRLWNFGTSDNGGVHTNSGVLNHWYYILTVGKTGVNEQGQAYSVTGLGFLNAARIAYRAERLYLTPNSDYRSARIFTIQAAEDLFGAGSAEVIAVIDAWYAVGLGNSSTAPAGAVAQCPTDDAAVLTASASASTLCAGDQLTLTATATFPSTRRLRNMTGVSLPDGVTTFTAVPVYSTVVTAGTTLQHGLESLYRNYGDLTGVRVKLRHDRPGQVALRLAVRGTAATPSYLDLSAALPAYTGSGTASLDILFTDAAATTLPATMGSSLSGSYRPATALGSITPGNLSLISLEGKDGQVGSAGVIELVELLFTRAATDRPTVRWVGPGVDVATATALTTPAGPSIGGVVNHRYTVLASDPYFGCTSTREVSVAVRQPLLVAEALQPELCAGRGQAFGSINLRVTADDSIAGQTYQWSGPAGYSATGKRRSTTPTSAGRLRYTVRTTTPGSNCSNQRSVVVMANRPVAAAPAGTDSVACVGGIARLRSRLLENQLVGPYQFTGSVQIPDNNVNGVRIPLTVAGPAEGFFNLRGISVNITHTYIGDLELYVEAPDGTRVLLSRMNGDAGRAYNTLFIDSVGARALGSGAAPYAGTWQVDEPTGFAKLRTAAQTGTWNLWVRDLGPQDVGPVTAWGIVMKDNSVTWSGPNGFTASGSSALTGALASPGHHEYIGITQAGGCSFRDTVRVRVVPGPEWTFRQSTDLALAANWTCLPTPTTDAEVRGSSGRQPLLTTGLVQVRNLRVRAGTALTLNGGTLEVYGSLTLEPGATLTGSNGTLALRGANATISAATASALQVPRLLVNLPAATDTLRLAQQLTVTTALTAQQGILKTQASALTLAPAATISETAASYVSGQLLASANMTAAGTYDFGGAGASITAAGTSPLPGLTSLSRVTDQAIGRAPARSSIRRHYTFGPAQNQNLSLTLRLSYRDAELNGIPESTLDFYRAASLAGPWQPVSRSGQDLSLNVVVASNVTSLRDTWTLSNATAMLPTRSSAVSGVSVQALPVPFGAAGFSLALQLTKAQPQGSVAVYDLTGRKLFERALSGPAGRSSVALPEAGRLAAGVYLVRTTLGGETQTLRVTRE